MGWQINLEKNTVQINSQIALALYNCGADICHCWREECDWPMLGGIIYGGKLVFNPDHMEHMDYVWQPEVLQVLKNFKVKGDICFSSDDGDNRGQKWGYRFDGLGGMQKLKGDSIYKEEKEKPGKLKKKKAKLEAEGEHPLTDVRFRLEEEGIDYAFRNFSEFSEVNDRKFHKLRLAYIKAACELESYVTGEESHEDHPWNPR
jgi:hypothetical protein